MGALGMIPFQIQMQRQKGSKTWEKERKQRYSTKYGADTWRAI